jgi:large subunit ribosomal protein L21
MQAIVKSGKSQFTVSEGQELLLDTPHIEKVLMVSDGDKVWVGNPEVAGAVVKIVEIGQVRGPKVRTLKFKAKSRYRKVKGFRARLFKVKVESISVKSA